MEKYNSRYYTNEMNFNVVEILRLGGEVRIPNKFRTKSIV